MLSEERSRKRVRVSQTIVYVAARRVGTIGRGGEILATPLSTCCSTTGARVFWHHELEEIAERA